MNKIIRLLCISGLVICMSCSLCHAETDYSYGLILSEYISENSVVIVPEAINDVPIVAIGNQCFTGNEDVRSVILPDSVQMICAYAFAESTLEKIDMKEDSLIKFIGDGAFSLTCIQEIVLPKNLESFGIGVFYECGDLSFVNLPDTMYIIPAYSFFECDNLETINMPMYLERIEECAYYGCKKLKELLFPQTLKIIDERVFEGSGIEKVLFSEGLKIIMDNAFLDCKKLAYCELPKSLVYIGNNAFSGCEMLTLGVYADSYGQQYAESHMIPYYLIPDE